LVLSIVKLPKLLSDSGCWHTII